MTTDTMILEFIRHSRHCIPNSNPSASIEASVKNLYLDCLDSIVNNQAEAYIPSLILTNTYDKYSTLMPIRVGKNQQKYYLLYDVHLKEILRLFNALFFDEEDPGHDLWKLSYELFAEDALLENEEILLSYYGLNTTAKERIFPQLLKTLDPGGVSTVEQRLTNLTLTPLLQLGYETGSGDRCHQSRNHQRNQQGDEQPRRGGHDFLHR